MRVEGALSDSKKICGCVYHCRLLVCIQDIIVQCLPAILIAVMQLSIEMLSNRSTCLLDYFILASPTQVQVASQVENHAVTTAPVVDLLSGAVWSCKLSEL